MRLAEPCFADSFVRGEAFEGLEPAAEVVGGDEVGKVLPELAVVVIVVAFDGRFLDRAVHPFDLSIRPGMSRLGQAMFDVEIGAGGFEGVAAKEQLVCPHRLDVLGRPAITGRVGEVGAIVGEHGVHLVWHGGGQGSQEVARYPPGCLLVQLDEGELGCPVDRDEQV